MEPRKHKLVIKYQKPGDEPRLTHVEFSTTPLGRGVTSRQINALAEREFVKQVGELEVFEVVAENMTASEYVYSQVRDELKKRGLFDDA